ncbi:MAG: SRPBCC domain-containing protein [Nannocystaceae bacterium]
MPAIVVVTEAVLSAPIALVWQVLTDTAAYPEWNPVIRSLEPRGPMVAGGRASLTIALLEGAPPLKIGVRFRCVDHERQIGWVGGIPGITQGHHYFCVAPERDGTTRLTHGENFTGLLAAAVRPFARPILTARYELTNRAIAERCAALSQ